MYRAYLSNLIRRAGLLHLTDYLRYQILKLKNKSRNSIFRKDHPTIALPPDYILYESFAIDYTAYFEGGRASAKDLHQILSKHKSQQRMNILDWGCGPGRIIRHMPDYFDDRCEFYGTDANEKSIRWCAEHIPGISFSHNDISPPLDYEDQLFDIIYGISIFTHLSEAMHRAWIRDLHRVLRNDGILLFTTAGKAFKSKLTQKERCRFEQGELMVRSRVKEGHRTYSAFHPADFIEDLLSDFKILEHIEREAVNENIPQDIWIAKK
jgi:SAM-dependent methyltransferase